jgi:hypothetical protein
LTSQYLFSASAAFLCAFAAFFCSSAAINLAWQIRQRPSELLAPPQFGQMWCMCGVDPLMYASILLLCLSPAIA